MQNCTTYRCNSGNNAPLTYPYGNRSYRASESCTGQFIRYSSQTFLYAGIRRFDEFSVSLKWSSIEVRADPLERIEDAADIRKIPDIPAIHETAKKCAECIGGTADHRTYPVCEGDDVHVRKFAIHIIDVRRMLRQKKMIQKQFEKHMRGQR